MNNHHSNFHLGYMAGLRGQDPVSEGPDYEEGYLLGLSHKEAGVVAPKYLGFHIDSELPFTKGSVVTIPKGVPIRTMMSGEKANKVAGRTYKVTLHFCDCGMDAQFRGRHFEPPRPPRVCWAGEGGYWHYVDLNLIPEAQ